ncbi:uncharacterized protein LY89DRAFT_465594 [Mollisia scopiformis]|uniref:Uncharacterized protein n=1 Tax=Mollisia scopiformis TaxID=149040 RepID=A0A194XIF4_MOLSC|nr:uncharacterized protein LY89DRAFT_465594 [Mollisia scopiformis]KUJ19911.1 hypothetical protein LY89DRAFT_465594 [Mollisia scopiformis]
MLDEQPLFIFLYIQDYWKEGRKERRMVFRKEGMDRSMNEYTPLYDLFISTQSLSLSSLPVSDMLTLPLPFLPVPLLHARHSPTPNPSTVYRSSHTDHMTADPPSTCKPTFPSRHKLPLLASWPSLFSSHSLNGTKLWLGLAGCVTADMPRFSSDTCSSSGNLILIRQLERCRAKSHASWCLVCGGNVGRLEELLGEGVVGALCNWEFCASWVFGVMGVDLWPRGFEVEC